MPRGRALPDRLDDAALARARAAVEPMVERLGLEHRLRAFVDHRWAGTPRSPVLHLEDVSAIPFVSIVPGVEEYQHRARVRACDGDLFAAVTAPAPGYESYCRGRLGLGSPELIHTEAGDHPYAVASACCQGSAFERIVAAARRSGGLTIHPYMSIASVWSLAQQVARSAEVRVDVIGPPPPVLWIANDKALLSEVVSRVLSDDWLVETHAATEPAEMAAHMIKLAQRHQRVGLKRTRCASATGNAVYDLEKIRDRPAEEIVGEVRAFLERTEWACDEEVLIVAWEKTDDSPSTQLWIPPDGQGPPVVDGVYEQLLEGDEKVFLGSRPSRLPADVNDVLARASVLVATALQSMGYVGRCSFDFILVPDPEAGVRAMFTECNGRWGGTSTPMHLVERLVGSPRPAYWAQDFMHHDLIGVDFDQILNCVGDELFDPATGDGRYVFYNVGPLARLGKFDVIAIGATPEAAEAAIQEDLPRRLGLRP